MLSKSHFRVITAGAVLNADFELESTVVPTNSTVEKIVYKIAEDKILARGGGSGASRVQDRLPGTQARPKNAMTHPDHPGVFVWFADEK